MRHRHAAGLMQRHKHLAGRPGVALTARKLRPAAVGPLVGKNPINKGFQSRDFFTRPTEAEELKGALVCVLWSGFREPAACPLHASSEFFLPARQRKRLQRAQRQCDTDDETVFQRRAAVIRRPETVIELDRRQIPDHGCAEFVRRIAESA